MAKSTVKINSINSDGSVNVSFSVDDKDQNISGLTIDNKTVLHEELSKYGVAYEEGLARLVNKTVTADPTIEKNKNIAIGV